MAKLHLDRIVKRFGIPEGGWTGRPYRDLISLVIAQNTSNIQNKIVRISKEGWSKALRKIEHEEKRFIIPDVSDTLPKRAIYIRKAAEKSKLIGDTMRDDLTRNLKESLNQFTLKTGEATYIRRRGAKAGTINPKIISDFEKRIRGTFENYVKKDKIIGMPTNIDAIAKTEVRSAINEIKHQYMDKLVEKNSDLEVKKVWIHNPSLSKGKKWRKGHIQIANETARRPIFMNDYFYVPRYKNYKGREIPFGLTKMLHPHDPSAPGDQVIQCSCDIEYRVKRISIKNLNPKVQKIFKAWQLKSGKWHDYDESGNVIEVPAPILPERNRTPIYESSYKKKDEYENITQKYKEEIDKEWESKETHQELKNVAEYSGTVYYDITRKILGKKTIPLRNEKIEDAEKRIKSYIESMDNYISRHPLKENIDLYRGVSSKDIYDLNAGDTFIHKTFGSCSFSSAIAAEFSENFKTDIVLNIQGKPGNSIAPALMKKFNAGTKNIEFNKDEMEFIINRNQKFKVVGKEDRELLLTDKSLKKITMISVEII